MESLSSSNINNATSVNVLGPEYSVGSSYDLNSGVNNFSQGALSGMDNFNQGVSNNANGFVQNELISGNVGVPLIEENNFSQVTSSGMGGFDQNMSNGFVQGNIIGSEGFTQSVDVNNLSVNQTGGDNNSYLNQDNLNQYMWLDDNQFELLLCNFNNIRNFCLSKITGYEVDTIDVFLERNIYKDIKRHEYSKTLEAILNTEYYDYKYLDEYIDIDYVDDDNFMENITLLLNKGYISKDINDIYSLLSSQSIEVLIQNEYMNKMGEEIKKEMA